MTTTFDWNSIFQLPQAALAGSRIPKTTLARNAQLTKAEQKPLNGITRIEYYAAVQNTTTRIPSYIDDDYTIHSIIFLRCELISQSTAYAEMRRVLHRCFPHPTVLLFEHDYNICISCAITRNNLAEHGAIVVENTTTTGEFNSSDPLYKPLLDSLAFNSLPQSNLHSYIEEFFWRIHLGKLIKALGFYPHCNPSRREHLLELSTERDRLIAQQNAIDKQRHDPQLTLNDSAALRVKRRTITKRIEAITNNIKEICHE